jgi:hypothetical protein
MEDDMQIRLFFHVLPAALALTMAAAPAYAFHGSELDPPLKQHLAGLIQQLEVPCAAGQQAACVQKEQVRAVGNSLAMAAASCRGGDAMACHTLQLARQQLAGGAPAAPPAPVAATPPAGVAPGGGVVIGNPYDWRSYLPEGSGVTGNPYDWRNYGKVTGNPYDASSYGRGSVIGNPYDSSSYNTRLEGNPYDWRNYVPDE